MKRKIVVFDLDDTLYKEIDFLISAYAEIASWIKQEYKTVEVYSYMLESYKSKKDAFSCLIKEFDLPINTASLLNKYRAHFPHISLSKEVHETLAYLYKTTYAMGIITDGRELTQMNKIKALDLENYFLKENCIISETFGYSKPSLNAFIFFQQKYGEGFYYYIGDNTQKDFIAPNALGWATICLQDDGNNIHKQTFMAEDMKPEYIVSSLKEIISIVEA